MHREKILLVYDQECPVCRAYCQIVKIRESVGDLVIVNARECSEVLNEITAAGLDLDQGMVLKMGKKLYYGSGTASPRNGGQCHSPKGSFCLCFKRLKSA